MDLSKIISELDDEEKKQYLKQNASGYFRYLYYSKPFIPILKKLESNDKLIDEEWNYLIRRLFLVTYKAIDEENNTSFKDDVIYILSKIGIKITIKNGHLYNECYKMINFIESMQKEKDINVDLLNGINIVDSNKNMTDLDILLKQHREASIFRDNQNAYYAAYDSSFKGFVTESEKNYIYSMNRSYIREKNLVNKYNK
ncbi:MAG: hypothetical protein IJ097_03530 [Bacilli bacterium]|nr:hypothetical protein [Bacilli bacterium]